MIVRKLTFGRIKVRKEKAVKKWLKTLPSSTIMSMFNAIVFKNEHIRDELFFQATEFYGDFKHLFILLQSYIYKSVKPYRHFEATYIAQPSYEKVFETAERLINLKSGNDLLLFYYIGGFAGGLLEQYNWYSEYGWEEKDTVIVLERICTLLEKAEFHRYDKLIIAITLALDNKSQIKTPFEKYVDDNADQEDWDSIADYIIKKMELYKKSSKSPLFEHENRYKTYCSFLCKALERANRHEEITDELIRNSQTIV